MICFIASPISQISSVKSLRFASTPQLHLFPFHLQSDRVVPSRKLITVGDLKHSRIDSLFSKFSIEYPLFVLRFTNCSAFRISTDLNSLIFFSDFLFHRIFVLLVGIELILVNLDIANFFGTGLFNRR